MKPTESSIIYDNFAKHYRGYSSKKFKYILAIDNLIKLFFQKKVGSILDFGAGDGIRGANLFRLLEGKVLVFSDVSSEMLKRCRELNVASEVWNLNERNKINTTIRFDLVLCLWNVLGHIPSFDERVSSLRFMSSLLSENGKICFDVNNRHYIGYGRVKVLIRRFLDWLIPNYARGDVFFNWKIDGKTYPAHGHLFTHSEIIHLLQSAGLRMTTFKAVDYLTGKTSDDISLGQMFFIAEKIK